ncbi:protein kinase [Streptomyces sp. DSM 41982]|uniref:non-specific serine/threonine protein kinase n=1 Tax=Streptomyces evansiae TaxID=3075535 RepID=A0ABD5E967_9ACTN|nr:MULTISPECIES: protein kinase [unclassified Streptomyces]MDT0417152.1 protein kinase [Streptomyces sp. DSM 41982]
MSEPDRLISGRYRLLERVGSGGMGTVHLAEDTMLGRRVALKKLHVPPHLAEDELQRMYARTRREARSAAMITHPHVIVVHDVVDDSGLPCIVMEYVPSRTLADVLREDGPLPVAEAARIGGAMLSALRAAHAVGVLHRDVKPANVLLGEGGRVVLTDFGIAVEPGTPSLTRTGELIGSVQYLAPERLRTGIAVPGPPADLWALGATLYQAVEGQHPFDRPTPIETAYAIFEAAHPPPRQAGGLAAVLEGLLVKDPARRMDAATAARLLERAEREVGGWPEPLRGGGDVTARVIDATPSGGSPYPGTGAVEALPTAGAPPFPGTDTGTGTGPVAATAARQPEPGHPSPGRTAYPSPNLAATFPGEAPTFPYQPTPPHTRLPGEPARASRRRVLWWTLAAVVVAGVVTAGLVVRPWEGDRTGSGSDRKQPVAATGPASPARQDVPPVPEGYVLAQVQKGRVAVPMPKGWKVRSSGEGAFLAYAPGMAANLRVDVSTYTGDPLQHWQETEEPQTSHGVAAYQREKMSRTTYRGHDAAYWEYTYTDGGVRTRAAELAFKAKDGTLYELYLAAPNAKWQTYRPTFDAALDGFRFPE